MGDGMGMLPTVGSAGLDDGKKEGGRREGGVDVWGTGEAPSDDDPEDMGDIEGGGMLVIELSSSFLLECP